MTTGVRYTVRARTRHDGRIQLKIRSSADWSDTLVIVSEDDWLESAGSQVRRAIVRRFWVEASQITSCTSSKSTSWPNLDFTVWAQV